MINRLHRSERDCVSFRRIGSVEKDFETYRGVKEQTFSRPRRRASLPSTVVLAVCLVLAGCAANATKTNSVTPLISLAVNQAPPASLTVGGSASVSATVSNDLAAAGVDWAASCGSAPNCGSFSPPHTASGGTAVYSAPLAVPAKSTVTVTALSATDHSKASSTTVTIISTVTDVTITQPPPPSAPSATTVSFAATVSGDPANLGVDWKATCTTIYGIVDCTPGGFHSASGELRTFTVPGPLQVPSIVGGTVTVKAFATADHSYSAQATFTVTDPLTISLTQVPPSTMLVNATAPVMATVSNDITSSGVDWLVICSNVPCGSVSPSHTASGIPATYTAPPTAPAAGAGFGPGAVAIKATASATGGSAVVTATTNVTIIVPISIKLVQGVLNNTIVQNHTAKLVAAVSDDAANAGVDWKVTCGTPGNCGTFSPAHTASGAATTFTAPSAIPAGGGSVTITAASTTDPTKTATQTVTVTLSPPPNSLLSGQFVMLLTAKNSSNGPYVIGGVISGDGNGTITAGALDLADVRGNASPSVGVVSPSNYLMGPDGRGKINLTINTGVLNAPFGVNGTGAITLSVTFVTPQHALLSETDSFGSGTGTLDLQNLQVFTGLSGVYSLTLSGSEVSRPAADYFVASAVTIPSTSSSSYSYITDQADNGVVTSVPSATVQRRFISGAGSPGEILVSSVNLGLPTQFNLDLWPIDATHLVVTDWKDSAYGIPPVIVGGYLTAQPSSPAVSGTYAFTEAGATPAAQPQVAGGIFTCGSSTGTLDVTPLGGTPTTIPAITAACTPPTSGRGLITLSGAGAGAGSTGISQFAAYPTLDQGLYLIELDGGPAGTSGPSGAGVALQQMAPPISAAAFSGKYASNFLASTALGSQAFAAQVVPDGVSAIAGSADVNSFTATPPAGTPSFGATLAGSFTAGTNGRFPLVLKFTPATGQPTPNPTTINTACYVVDANTCLLLGLDSTAPGTGILQLQQTGL